MFFMGGRRIYRFVAVLSILIFLFRFLSNTDFFYAEVIHKTAEEVQVTGIVSGLPAYSETHTRFDFVSTERGLLRLAWYGPRPLLRPGTGWKIWVKIKPLQKDQSYDEYLRRRGYQGEGSVEALKPWTRQFDKDQFDFLNHWRFELRRKILFYATLSGVPEASRLLLALGIGDSSELTSAMWKTLQDTGTSHLVAISGLHIGLIGLLFYGLIRRAWSLSVHLSHRCASQEAGAIGGFLGAIGYGLISGLGIPAERTLIMLGMGALYRFLGRTPDSFKAWVLAFLICLALQPWGLFSLSMWLSFLAVFSLIYLLSHRIRLPSGIGAHLKFQFVLYWLLIPVPLYGFGVISTVAFWVNLWAIPWVSFFVVPVLLLGMVLMIFPVTWSFLPTTCFYLAGKAALLWWWGLNLFAHFPYAAFYLNPPSLRETLLAQIGLFWFFAPRGIPGRPLGLLCLIPVIIPWGILAFHHFLVFGA